MPSSKKKKNNSKESKKDRVNELFQHPEKISAKRIAKAMPDLADRIERKDRTAPFYPANAFMECAVDSGCLSGPGDIWSLKTKGGNSIDMFEYIFGGLSTLAVPGSSPKELHLRRRLALRMRLILHLQKTYNKDGKRLDNAFRSGPIKMQETLHSIFREAVDHYRREIIGTCFQGDEEVFMRECRAYTATTEEFFASDILDFRDIEWKECAMGSVGSMIHQSTIASREIAFGMHKSERVCWQCGKGATKQCAKCNAAWYCGRDCQTSHWKEHKLACKDLKVLVASFEDSMERINLAFDDPDSHQNTVGIEPSTADYPVAVKEYVLALPNKIMERMHKALGMSPTTTSSNQTFDISKEPSMHLFYSNLYQVIHNGFWMYPTWPETKRTARLQKHTKQSWGDSEAFKTIARALMYDYSYGDTQNATTLDQTRFRDRVNTFLQPTEKSTDDCLVQMTPEEWLSYYNEEEERIENEEEELGYVRAIRKRSKHDFYEGMRDLLSKREFVDMLRANRRAEREMMSQA